MWRRIGGGGPNGSGRTGMATARFALFAVWCVACEGNGPLPAQQTRGTSSVAAAALRSGEARAESVSASVPVSVRALVQQADSLEHRQRWREAADVWAAAAERMPPLHPWFMVRAASAHPEARVRARWLASIRLPATADTVAWQRRQVGAHLRALLRHGDTTAAVQQYLRLGNVRDSVVGLSLRMRHGVPLSLPERLELARGARRIGDGPLARREYAVVLREAPALLRDADRLDYGMVLFTAGRYGEALPVFAGVRGAEAGMAAYQRARAELRLGRGAEAVAALRAVAERFPRDTAAAGLSLYLLGDLAADAGRDDAAAGHWRTLALRYPTHTYAPRAALRSAIVHIAANRWREALGGLMPLATRSNTERQAARYWVGRGHEALGDRRRADSVWRAIVADAPDSYYALLAARRLGVEPWASDDSASPPAVASESGRMSEAMIGDAVQRAAWLDSLGWHDEARETRNELIRAASEHVADARATARRLVGEEQASPAIALALRTPALAQSRRRDDQRLRYPLPFAASLASHARAERLAVPFMAALIRQESRFTPTARSGAGALGLMQVMPAVGRSLGARLGIAPWHDSLLFVPEVNLRLGSRHLAAALRQDAGAHPAYALAAYNAGRSRMLRWRAKRGAASDWELFVERIPFDETRDYVRIVLRNEEWYRTLYPALSPPRARSTRGQDE